MDQLIAFFKESYAELQKVTWLSRQEVIGSTAVIVVLIAIMAVFVWAVDVLCIKFVGWIL